MAASAKWLGRIASAIHGANTAGGSSGSMRRLIDHAADIPEGYALTRSGILVPYTNELTGFDRGVQQLEVNVLDKVDKAAGLVYRLTKAIVGTAACGFVLKLTWYEMTDTGNLQNYLPGGGQPAPLGYLSKKAIVDEVNATKIAEYNNLWTESTFLGIPFQIFIVEKLLAKQKKILKKRGFCDSDILDAQMLLTELLLTATREARARAVEKLQAAEGAKSTPPESSK